MNTTIEIAPFAGKTFEVRYAGLTALNAYATDGVNMRYEITEGPYKGAAGEVKYAWRQIAPGIFAISWQEADRSTVVHIDDFYEGTSCSFFTTAQLELHRLEGTLRQV
ncbi:adenylate cyclase [Burkholderia sp. Ac-20365]|uniref:MoaF-related domain-containing protein n=1 Tax=Burkholderia sp. Ac-20365 TaxID=2703897 RepID=UPI00197BCD6F|nr:adenylate cyclase [Burkholderia sp. Ac-20365]MBN3761618.1 adenylate cyclase [Burkholderia sp. Ac-20365]